MDCTRLLLVAYDSEGLFTTMSRIVFVTACIPLDDTKPMEWKYWPFLGVDKNGLKLVMKDGEVDTIIPIPSFNFEIRAAMSRLVDTQWCRTAAEEMELVRNVVEEWFDKEMSRQPTSRS